MHQCTSDRDQPTHLDVGKLVDDVLDALLAAQHRDDLDLVLLQPPVREHPQRRDGRAARSDQRCRQLGLPGRSGGLTVQDEDEVGGHVRGELGVVPGVSAVHSTILSLSARCGGARLDSLDSLQGDLISEQP